MAIPIDQRAIEQLSHLEFHAKQTVEGFITGMHKSPFHGFSVEFAEHRPYNPGESTRHIDWKLYARTEKLFVKRYEEETNLRCHLLIDDSSSMYFPDVKIDPEKGVFNKIGFAVHAAASLIKLLQKQRDAVGITQFAEDLELHTEAKSNESHTRFLFHQLEQLLDAQKGKEQRKTFAVDVLHKVAQSIHKRGLVVIFSDMMDNSDRHEELFTALQHLRHNKHEVLLFHVMDEKKELEFHYQNRPYAFIDKETGEQVKANPGEVRDAYLRSMREYYEELKLRCAQYGVDLIPCDVSRGFYTVLFEYLTKRSKMY